MNKKISELTETAVLDNNDLLPIVTDNGTQKVKYSVLKNALAAAMPVKTLVSFESKTFNESIDISSRNTIHSGDAIERNSSVVLNFTNQSGAAQVIEFRQNLSFVISVLDPFAMYIINSENEALRIAFKLSTYVGNALLNEDYFDEAIIYIQINGNIVQFENKMFSKSSTVMFNLSNGQTKQLVNKLTLEILEFQSSPDSDVSADEDFINIRCINVQPSNVLNTKIFS
jgi:hypothetical protein